MCGQDFKRPASYRGQLWANRKYCSQACAGKAKSAIWRARWERRTCPICGEEFSAKAADMRWKATCGKPACKAEYQRTVAKPKAAATMRADYASGKRKAARGYSEQERVLWPTLRPRGWKWRLRWTDAWGTLEIDFALSERKLAIEIDGPNHRNGRARKKRDRARDAHLRALGWRILRIPNADVDADAPAVAQRIIAWADSQGDGPA